MFFFTQNSSCLNPNFPPYPPPPLRSSPTYSSVTYETSDRLLNTSLRKAGEQYESDSGISLDHSPKGEFEWPLKNVQRKKTENGSICLKRKY